VPHSNISKDSIYKEGVEEQSHVPLHYSRGDNILNEINAYFGIADSVVIGGTLTQTRSTYSYRDSPERHSYHI